MDEITGAIKRQREFFSSGETENLCFRRKQLKKLASLISHSRNEILKAINDDFRRPHVEIFTSEFIPVLWEIEIAVKNLKNWSKPRHFPVPVINKPARAYSIRRPFGVSLIIGPWNYPAGLLLTPLVSSIAAGNCSILKPSEHTPHLSDVLKRLISCEFDPGFISVIEGGKETALKAIESGVEFVFFTGGKAAGANIMSLCASKTIPLVLELGGKNPCIMDRRTDPVTAARRIVWGKFFNAGQTCTAPDYCLVQREMKDALVKSMISSIEKFFSKDPRNSSSFSRIINHIQFDRITSMLGQGSILYGGKCIRDDLYISPTLIDNLTADSPLLTEEIFGPVLPIICYETPEDVLSIANNLPAPVASYVFSENRSTINFYKQKLRTGNLCVNGTLHLMLSKGMPFGGTGASGFGRYHGKAGFEAFSYEEAVLDKDKLEITACYPPYRVSPGLLNALRKFLF